MSDQPIRSTHYALERSLSERYGLDVVISDAIDAGQVYLMPKDTYLMGDLRCGAHLFETLEPRWEAVAIVQEGMAEIVAWLKAAGHDMPDAWAQQAEDQRRRGVHDRDWVFDHFASLAINNPRSSVIVTGAL